LLPLASGSFSLDARLNERDDTASRPGDEFVSRPARAVKANVAAVNNYVAIRIGLAHHGFSGALVQGASSCALAM
jgi:hypothetical protein